MSRKLLLSAVAFVLAILTPYFAHSFVVVSSYEVSDTGWLNSDDRDVLETMNVRYTKPAGFLEKRTNSECFGTNPKLKKAFECLSNRLVSEDGEVVLFAPIYRIMTKEDSVLLNSFSKGSVTSLNRFHTNIFKVHIRHLQPESLETWRDGVYYYSREDTKQIFNADTAMFWSFILNKKDSYLGKYRNIYSLVIQKKDKGYLQLIVFYSNKGKRTFRKRFKDIERMFVYQE